MARYEKGRKCLVLNSWSCPELIGSEVVLGTYTLTWTHPDTGEIHPGKLWNVDPPIIKDRRSVEYEVGFFEPWLLPIDDEDINKELEHELLETKPKELAQET